MRKGVRHGPLGWPGSRRSAPVSREIRSQGALQHVEPIAQSDEWFARTSNQSRNQTGGSLTGRINRAIRRVVHSQVESKSARLVRVNYRHNTAKVHMPRPVS
jgi:hypothetical protein